MRADNWDGIFFLLDGNEYAFRGWSAAMVPRVGDWIVFPSTDEPFKVTRVIWRETTGKVEPIRRPYAEVCIEHVRAPDGQQQDQKS